MTTWSTDIRTAPHGRYEIKQRREGVDIRIFVPERVVLATKCGKVTISHYQPEVKRWEMLADGELPVAWMHHQPGQKLPEYPHSLLSAPGAMNSPARTTSSPSSSGTNPHEPARETASAGDFKRVITASDLQELTDGDTDAGGSSRSANPQSLPVPQSQAAERPDALPLAASGHQSRADGGANIIMKHEEIRS